MNKNNILIRAFVDAFGVVVYVAALAWFMNNINSLFRSEPDGWLGSIFLLVTFIISACITGSLVLLKPILLFIENQKRHAVELFLYTLGFLVVIAVIILSLLIGSASRPISPVYSTPQRCGGNMMKAPQCTVGYHCAPVPGSRLPVGDIGGICVAD